MIYSRLVLAIACCVSAMTGAGPAPAESPVQEARSPTLADLAFMAGQWRAGWHGAILEEHFAVGRDGAMIGMFQWSSEGGTRFTEHIVIEERDDGVFMYLRHFNPGSVVWEQEVDGPLTFSLTESSQGRAVFEDSSRVFPRRIVYHRVLPDTMVVRLEGRTETGEPRDMEFKFRSTSMSTTTETLTESGLSIGYSGDLTIACEVKDIRKSIDWYQNVLGFKVVYHMEEMGWCEVTTAVGNVTIGLSQVEKVTPGGPTPTFSVKDIDRARKLLEDKGVRFDGDTIEIDGMVKLATFYDPDGNSLMFSESLSTEIP